MTLQGKSQLRNAHFMLVLKGIFGGSQKKTKMKIARKVKNILKRFSGFLGTDKKAEFRKFSGVG